MSLDEEALEVVANGGSMDLEKWAGMVVPLLDRLEHIVHNVFPMPKVPRGSYGQQPFQPSTQESETNNVPSESSNKENAAPGDPQTPPQAASGYPSTERVPESQHHSSSQESGDSLPPQLALLLKNIRSAIESFFVEKPPHTIQRLAELILRPTAHYKTLPAYMRAVDRVVSVTSGVDVFPFNAPVTTASPQANGLVHPTNSAGTYLTPDYAHGLGSDESLGGALLTPIPWLTNVSFEGEDANALEEEETAPTQAPETAPAEDVGAVTTEGEEPTASASSPGESADEVPHARGPPVLGVEDMGLQDGKGVEMTLAEQENQGSAAADGSADANAAASEPSTGAPEGSETNPADKDGDIVLEDRKPKEETKAGEESPESALASESEKKE